MGTKKPRYTYITVSRSLQDTANPNGTSKNYPQPAPKTAERRSMLTTAHLETLQNLIRFSRRYLAFSHDVFGKEAFLRRAKAELSRKVTDLIVKEAKQPQH